MSDKQNKTPDLVNLSRSLAKIGKIEKCEGCSCYIDTINEFDAVLKGDGKNAPTEARDEIDDLSKKHQSTHNCIGCDPCYPVAVSNRLYEISGGKSADIESLSHPGACNVPTINTTSKSLPVTTNTATDQSFADTSCGCKAPSMSPQLTVSKNFSAPEMAWTVETGDYRLGNPRGSVAIATLASEELYKQFSTNLCDDDCSICGKVFTENIGIEKVVKNIVANPSIRFLMLCGQEAKGHQTGACIKALHANGIDERGRIADAPGKRPWIKSLTVEQVKRFQEQVELVDLIGCDDPSTIEAKASELAQRNPGAMSGKALKAEGVPHHLARETVKLKLDRSGFFIIHPKPEANWLMVEHYENSGKATCVIEGSDPAKICAEIIERGLIGQLDHAAYLGRELERAKLSMQMDFTFRQDRALGDLNGEDMPEW